MLRSFPPNKYLEKIAAKAEGKTTNSKAKKKSEGLRPHQEESLQRLEENKGLLLHHSTGSGKTKTFLVAAQRALERDKQKRVLIVAPASLVTNIDKELAKHGITLDKSRLDVMSYEKAVNRADELRKNDYSIAIADEAQKLRNPETKRVKTLAELITNADQRLLATATANYNHSADIAPLMNIVTGETVLPEGRKDFEKKFIKEEEKPRSFRDIMLRRKAETVEVLRNKGELKDLFEKHVHYYDSEDDPEAQDKFPTKSEKVIEVDMGEDQKKYYQFVEGKMPFMMRMKIRHNLPMDKKEMAQMNAFATGVRQVSNSHRHLVRDGSSIEASPKIQKAVESLEKSMSSDKNFRGVVYSNFLGSGVHEYSALLQKRKIAHAMYTGGLSAAQKDQMVKDYNSGKNPVLLISSSGAEGLDLKGTKKTQIIEPHFNPSKIKQVIGRGRRYESHAHLPKEERHMEVEHYLSVHPKPMLGQAPYSIDKYLHSNSQDKSDVFDQIKGVMKNSSKPG